MVRYYGFYSPALRGMARGKRKNQDQDDLIPSILEPVVDPDFSGNGSSSEYRKNWARLIQKISEVDPLTCPKCSGKMKIISVIEDEDVIKKILKHLGLWDQKVYPPSVWRARPVCVHRTGRPPPKANLPPMSPEYHIDYTDPQLPASDKWLAEGHDFSVIDPVYPEIFPA